MAINRKNKITKFITGTTVAGMALLTMGAMQPAGAAGSNPFGDLIPQVETNWELDLDIFVPPVPLPSPDAEVVVNCSDDPKVFVHVENTHNEAFFVEVTVDGEYVAGAPVSALSDHYIPLSFEEDDVKDVQVSAIQVGILLTESVEFDCFALGDPIVVAPADEVAEEPAPEEPAGEGDPEPEDTPVETPESTETTGSADVPEEKVTAPSVENFGPEGETELVGSVINGSEDTETPDGQIELAADTGIVIGTQSGNDTEIIVIALLGLGTLAAGAYGLVANSKKK